MKNCLPQSTSSLNSKTQINFSNLNNFNIHIIKQNKIKANASAKLKKKSHEAILTQNKKKTRGIESWLQRKTLKLIKYIYNHGITLVKEEKQAGLVQSNIFKSKRTMEIRGWRYETISSMFDFIFRAFYFLRWIYTYTRTWIWICHVGN